MGQVSLLDSVRLLAICLLGFAGFMRCEELLKLERADVKFKEEGMVLSIQSSKTDQFREGDSLLVGRTGAITCPVQMMERYFRMGRMTGFSELSSTPRVGRCCASLVG